MGCDIHLYDEKKVDGKWQIARPDVWGTEYPDEVDYPDIAYRKHLYNDRNYDLFAVLADVRNGRGFAGVDTGDGFNPISPPRGLPEDVSPEVKAVSDGWGEDGHSHSWFTVQELLDYDWTQTTKLRGWVNAETYYRWRRWGRDLGDSPSDYCGGVSGPQIKHVTVEEMDRIIDSVVLDCKNSRKTLLEKYSRVYCQVEWEQPYYRCVGSFLSNTIPQLLRMGKPDDVRIVFWFDN